MNIVMKNSNYRDPFAQSDRLNPIGGGKGDADRTKNRRAFWDRFPKSMGPKKQKTGKA